MPLKLRHLDPKKTVFFLCDIQEKFRNAFPLFNNLITNVKRLTEAGQILEIPLVVSEQTPAECGKTVPTVNINHAKTVICKSKFSMMSNDMNCILEKVLDGGGKPKDIILYGLETHISVEQTAIDFMEQNINVSVVGDCTLSRSNQDRDLAFQRLRQAGCNITSVETILYDLLRDMQHPKFKELQKYLKELPCDMEISVYPVP